MSASVKAWKRTEPLLVAEAWHARTALAYM